MNTVELLKGDCLDKLKELGDNSVDSIVTDPPYMIGFMGKGWDSGDNNIVGKVELWRECLRVLKPGGHLLSFGATRTYHRMTVAIEDAGFEIRDCIFWCYGSGFPKSHNIGKAIDKIEGNEREVVGSKGSYRDMRGGALDPNLTKDRERLEIMDTKGNSPYEGWGTSLKPAVEPIVMGRKPFSGTVANNVLEWGTGGINIDGCRIGNEKVSAHHAGSSNSGTLGWNNGDKKDSSKDYYENEGRFPANLILDEEAGKVLDLQSGERKGFASQNCNNQQLYGGNALNSSVTTRNGFKEGYNDSGGASRFFYCPKTSKKDRNEGCDGLPQKANVFMSPDSRTDKEHYDRTSPGMERFKTEPKSNYHPTIKPTALMSYLIRLVTPKGGTVLDPFMGSGSTGKAAVREGMSFIGIEREEDYYQIAKSRIEYEQSKTKYTEFFDV